MVSGEHNDDGVVTVRRGIPEGNQRRAAQLYWEAFGRKLGPALNPPDRAVAFLAEHLHPDRAVTALLDGRLVGIAAYQRAGRSLTGVRAGEMLRAYGRVAGLYRLALLRLLHRVPAAGELVLDGIVVAPEARGRGIGSLLLDEVFAVAADAGCQEVRLDVVDVNLRARALYERRGFLATHTEHTPYLRRLMGFGAVITMHRLVAGPATA